MDMWERFIKEPSSKLVSLLGQQYKQTGDLPTLYNLGLAVLDIGDWQRAYEIYQRHRGLIDFTGEGEFINLGLTQWFMGDHKGAIGYWQQSLETQYTNDPVGPINGLLILWYAGQRLADDRLTKELLKKLKRFWKVQDYRVFSEWPGTIAIAGFLLDSVPEDVFLNQWKWGNLENRRLCRANFWVGMKYLDKSRDEAAKHFNAAFSTKIAILEYEYFLAKWEYSKLTGENLWAHVDKR